MKRKLLLTLLALTMVFACTFALAACGKGNDNSGTTPPDTEQSDNPGTTPPDTEQGDNPRNDDPDTEQGGNTPTPSKPASEGLKFRLKGNSGYTLTGKGSCTDAEIIIPSTYNGKPVVAIDNAAFYNCKSLTSITIPDGVTSIGGSAFEDCSGLTSIYYDGGIAGWCGISGLNNLMLSSRTLYIDGKEITGDLVIPNGVTSIGGSAFRDCSGLTSVTIPDSVTEIGDYAFMCCSGLTSVTVESGNTKYHSAGNCIIETANKTLIVGCMTSIIPNNGSVTSIGEDAFAGCTGLTSITIPDSVTSIGEDAFAGCTGLTSVTVTSGNAKYHSAGNCIIETATKTLIVGCMTSIIPNDGSATSIGEDAFAGCTGLTSITIPDSVTIIGDWAFTGCTSLTSITIPDSVTYIRYGAFTGCTSLTSITIPSSVTYIYSYAFYGCSGLTSITIPDSVTEIGIYMFYGCTGLTSITIPSSVTDICHYAFEDCSGLTNIDFKGTKTQWYAIKRGDHWNYGTGKYTVQCTDGKLDKYGDEIE